MWATASILVAAPAPLASVQFAPIEVVAAGPIRGRPIPVGLLPIEDITQRHVRDSPEHRKHGQADHPRAW
jgi:hypothetical protein